MKRLLTHLRQEIYWQAKHFGRQRLILYKLKVTELRLRWELEMQYFQLMANRN